MSGPTRPYYRHRRWRGGLATALRLLCAGFAVTVLRARARPAARCGRSPSDDVFDRLAQRHDHALVAR